MKVEHLVDAIGNINDEYITEARKKNKKRNNSKIIRIFAACVGLALILPVMIMGVSELGGGKKTSNDSISNNNPQNEMAVLYDNVNIYFVDDGEIQSESEYLACDPKEVFFMWKDKNGIGTEIVLLDCHIEDNSTTTEHEDGSVSHTVGDYYELHITVSKELENYYETIDKELLLESLEKTMTGYSGIEYDAYYLHLE